LREYIFNTSDIKQGLHSSPGNNTGSFRCRSQHNLTCTRLANHFMMYTAAFGNRYTDQVFLCIIKPFLNGVRDFIGFAQSMAYDSILVTDDDNSIKTETTS